MVDAMRARDYSKMWNEFLTPAMQMACPESSFLAVSARNSPNVGRIEFEDLSASVDGDRGTISYRITVDGSTVATTEGDVWEKVDGTWYNVLADSELAKCQAGGG